MGYINFVISQNINSVFCLPYMKLQRVRAREYKGKTIYKYMIVIPPKDIKTLGWENVNELEGMIIQNKGYFLSVRE